MFSCLRDKLITALILKHPDFWRTNYILHTNASNVGVASVLSQKQARRKPENGAPTSTKINLEEAEEEEVIISYASRHLKDSPFLHCSFFPRLSIIFMTLSVIGISVNFLRVTFLPVESDRNL